MRAYGMVQHGAATNLVSYMRTQRTSSCRAELPEPLGKPSAPCLPASAAGPVKAATSAVTWRATPVARSSTACAQQLATAFDESWRSLIDHRADPRRTEPRSRWEVVERGQWCRVPPRRVRACSRATIHPHPKPTPIVVRADHLLPDLTLLRKNSITMCSASPHHIDSALPPRRSPVLRLWRFAHALSHPSLPGKSHLLARPTMATTKLPYGTSFPTVSRPAGFACRETA